MSAILETLTPAYILKLHIQRDTYIRENVPKTNLKGCIYYDDKKNSKSPSLKVLYLDKKNQEDSKMIRLHKIMFFLRYRKNAEISHRCHLSSCINPEHMILESHQNNCLRRTCKKTQKCEGHGQRDDFCIF